VKRKPSADLKSRSTCSLLLYRVENPYPPIKRISPRLQSISISFPRVGNLEVISTSQQCSKYRGPAPRLVMYRKPARNERNLFSKTSSRAPSSPRRTRRRSRHRRVACTVDSSTTGAHQLPLTRFAAHPQSQRFRFFRDLTHISFHADLDEALTGLRGEDREGRATAEQGYHHVMALNSPDSLTRSLTA
jgi:hypothetical protein